MIDKEFITTDHESMIENMNRISDDLLKAYWYYLLALAALGTAYKTVFDLRKDVPAQYFVVIVIIALVGNIVFWKISEYAISHGFLFRYIQTKVAKIEKIMYPLHPYAALSVIIKDPTDFENFAKNYEGDKANEKGWILNMDHQLPDQFIPLYWAAMWLIVVNTVFAAIICRSNTGIYIFPFLLISLPFIMKLWRYYLHKIRQFVESNCDFTFDVQNCEKRPPNFFEFIGDGSMLRCGFLLAVCGALVVCALHFLSYNSFFSFIGKVDLVLSLFVSGFFYPVFLGYFIHIFHHFVAPSYVKKHPYFTLKISEDGTSASKRQIYKVAVRSNLQWLLNVLYKIV